MVIDGNMCVCVCAYKFPVLVETEHEENRIEDIRFAGSIETSNRIELRVEPFDHCTCGVALKALHDDFLNVHLRKAADDKV